MVNRRYYTKNVNGCWNWNFSLKSNGYGQVFRDGKNQYAHRWVYELYFGDIPEDKELDHLCRNKACVNPDHLDLVSHSTNGIRSHYFQERSRICLS